MYKGPHFYENGFSTYLNTILIFYTASQRTAILDFWAGSKNYGFYFRGHANASTLWSWHYEDPYDPSTPSVIVWEIKRSLVQGNWHFVYLDACKTAVDDGWARAFNATSTNRGYLGWNGSPMNDDTYDFNVEFWSLIGPGDSIRQAAIDAANSVPGAGTTPIRFYGDTSYDGCAWS